MQTEYEFKLPKGYVDANGDLHQSGIMRLATAADEILPLRDPRVQQNPSYLTIVILSRVIVRIGDVSDVDTRVVEKLFARDLAFLNDMYQRLNGLEDRALPAVCPQCGHSYEVPLNFTQEE